MILNCNVICRIFFKSFVDLSTISGNREVTYYSVDLRQSKLYYLRMLQATFFSAIILSALASSLPPLTHPLREYIRIDTSELTFKKASYADELSNKNISHQVFKITYQPALENTSAVEIGLCISKLFMSMNYQNILFLNMETVNQTLSSFEVQVYSFRKNQDPLIFLLEVRLIVVSKNILSNHFYIQNARVSVNQNVSRSQVFYGNFSIQNKDPLKIFNSIVTLNSFWTQSKGNNMDINLNTLNISNGTVYLLVSSDDMNSTFVKNISFVWIYCDNNYFSQDPKMPTFEVQNILSASRGFKHSTINMPRQIFFENKSIFLGIRSFSLHSQVFNFNTDVRHLNQIVVSHFEADTSIQISFLALYQKCPSQVPFFNPADRLCYDICPQRTVIAHFLMQCFPCPLDCLTCEIGGKCISCAEGEFRELSFGRCSAIDGYYDNGSKICLKCPQDCISCYNYDRCQQCNEGLYLQQNGSCRSFCPSDGYFHNRRSFQCQKCDYSCLNCKSATYCDLCRNGTYTIDIPGRGFRICRQNCQGLYYLNSDGKCLACPSRCHECINENKCISCSSNYQLNSDGQCKRIPFHIWYLTLGIIFCMLGVSIRAYGRCIRRRRPMVEVPSQPIEDSVQQIQVRQDLVQLANDFQCSICLMTNSNIKTHCNHYYHIGCLLPWMKVRAVCPNCITPFRKSSEVILICSYCQMNQSVRLRRFMKRVGRRNVQVYICHQCKFK